MAFRDAADQCKSYKESILVALQSSGDSLLFAVDVLCEDQEVARVAVMTTPCSLLFGFGP